MEPNIQASETPDTPVLRREGEPAPEKVLDMANRKDVAMLHNGIKRRWNVPLAKREELKADLDWARDAAKGVGDYEGVVQNVRTWVAMAGQDQADDHLQDKNDRLDTGKLTENAGLTFNIIPVEPPGESTQEGR